MAVFIMVGLVTTGGILYCSLLDDLKSSPTAVRPWAEAEFRKWTMPVPSPGNATDPQYLTRCGRPVYPHGKSSPRVEFEIQPAAESYVPKCEVIDFDSADGFTSASGHGKVLWLGAKTFRQSKPDDREYPQWAMFQPNGEPMPRGNADAMLQAEPIEMYLRDSPNLSAMIAVDGYQNVIWKFRQLFDSNTHVPLQDGYTDMTSKAKGAGFSASLPALHDAPLLAVIDLFHGAIQNFSLPAARGSVVVQPEFRFEVIETLDGAVETGAYNLSTVPHMKKLAYDGPKSSVGTTCSVLYQVTPPVLRDAITLEAFDSEGHEIKGAEKTTWDLALHHFDGPVIRIASLRVRYRPNFTRLLLRIKSMPAVDAPNLKPTNLFDLTVPEIVFRNPGQMQCFIADTVEFNNPRETNTSGDESSFPMTLHDASPRQVIDRYRALNSDRSVNVDPVAMTVQFEDRRRRTWLNRTLDWMKNPTWGR
ncbi:MAG: hypothetical protein V4819_17150 [Verrucomicrobiota bacterium]